MRIKLQNIDKQIINILICTGYFEIVGFYVEIRETLDKNMFFSPLRRTNTDENYRITIIDNKSLVLKA